MEEGEELGEEGETPPDYVAFAVDAHFAERDNERLQNRQDVRVAQSGIALATAGLFANRAFAERDRIGMYTGSVIYERGEMEDLAERNDKLHEFKVWGNDIWVDAEDTWAGKMNHQWNWPAAFGGFPHSSWAAFFSNAAVEDDATVTATRFADRLGFAPLDWPMAVPAANAGDELFIDYGAEYWEGADSAPFWDLRSAPGDLLQAVLTEHPQWPLLQQLGRRSSVVLRKDQGGIVNDRQVELYNIQFVP